ncbi:Uncharacterised protein [Clostridioides difficile]|nr:Uncharacterised protein [Clostridioides difficile]
MKFSNIPCDITVFEANDDSNLLSVKLRIVNIGKNLNKTKFSEESIKNAESTICNIPILGYLEYDDDDEIIDFDNHNIITKIIKCPDGLKIEKRYMERPIGVIPSDTRITYEEYNGETYLCATGYVWKCYANEGYQLLLDSDEKSVSMEISVFEGEADVDGYYDIKKFTFLGVTVLGDDVTPAIQGANITKYSHMQNYKKAIEDICNEIYKMKKEKNVVTNIKQEPIKKTQNQVFSLSVENITDQTFNQLKTKKITKTDWWGDEYEARAYYFRELLPNENIVVVESSENYGYFGIPYLVKENTVVLDFENKKEYISTQWRERKTEDIVPTTFDLDRDSELKDIVLKKISQTETDMKEMNSELEGLKEFKKSIDDAQYETEIKEIIEDFSFEEEEIKTFKEKVLNREITKEEFQKELFALQGMKYVNQIKDKQNKKNFTKEDEGNNTFTKINNQSSSNDDFDVYGGLGKKYL